MYISYSSSNEYSEYTGISIVSLFENCKNIRELTVFLINNNINDKNIEKILEMSKKYNRKIILIDPRDLLKKLTVTLPSFNGSYSAYCKILCDELYPSYVDKLLVIDSDTIINNSLEELESIDITDKIIAAVENPSFYLNKTNYEIETSIISKNGFYFNSGVMYMNLEKWRNSDFSKKIINSIKLLDNFSLADQTILNYAISKSEYIRLPYKYNYWGHLYPSIVKEWINKYLLNYFTKTEIEDADICPTIIHYKGYDSRPWFKESTSLMKDKYLFYKNLSPWSETPLENCFKDPSFIKMNKKDKFKAFIRVKYFNSKLIVLYYKLRYRKEK